MEQIERIHLIEESELNQEFYFQSLFQKACLKQLLTDTQIERIQMELIELMAKEVERYTNDESSSIPIELAQELLQSITYSIGFYLKTQPDMEEKLNILKTEKISAVFYKGMEAVALRKNEAYQILQYLLQNPLKVDNYSYQDTVTTGLPEFFHDYNIEFGAHLLKGFIDYPLFTTITGLLGVEYFDRYLYNFKLEYDFLKSFSVDAINELLYGFDKDAEHLLINIFELVLTNALGCILLEKKAKGLNIGKEELPWLQESLEKLKQEELERRLQEAFCNLKEEMNLLPEIVDYICSALPQIETRLMRNLQTKTLNKLFISFVARSDQEEEILDSGIAMEDEQLRIIIEEINTYPSIAEKVRMIQQKVQSIPDVVEILEECFYQEEFMEVFQLFDELECGMIKKYILNEEGFADAADFEPQKEWQKVLFSF